MEPADRIATFDNDGTMWVEKPAPPQVDFMFRAFGEAARDDQSLAGKQPYKAILEKDDEFFGKVAEQDPKAMLSLEEAIARAWTGTTPEQFEGEVREFFSTVKQEKFGVSYTGSSTRRCSSCSSSSRHTSTASSSARGAVAISCASSPRRTGASSGRT